MSASQLQLFRLTPHRKFSSEPFATYERDDGTLQYFQLQPLLAADLIARLQPVASSWSGKTRRTEDGHHYKVFAIGTEGLHDDIYLVCHSVPPSVGPMAVRCWPLNEFERLRNPPY